MAKKATGKRKARDPSTIVVEQTKAESDEKALARVVISPSLQSALAIKDYGKSFGDLDVMGLVDALRDQIDQSIGGDLQRAEATLTTQAHTLDAIFSNLARRALNAEYMANFDTFLKLGLRAQSQCRATLETLAAIKNPVGRAYVGQANFAHNQQVNNAEPSRTREKQSLQNEQLEQTDGKRLDPGTPPEAIRGDQAMETVGAEHRSTDN